MRKLNWLIAGTLAVAIAAIIMIAFALSDSINEEIEKEFATYQGALAESSAKTLRLFFGELESELKLLAKIPAVQNLDVGKAHREFLSVVRRHRNQLFTILLVNFSGEIIVDPLFPGHVDELKKQIRVLFKKVIENRGPTISDKIVYKGDFKGFALGVPLVKDIGRNSKVITGMVVAYISQSHLVKNLLDSIEVKEGGAVLIMTHNGLLSTDKNKAIVRDIIHRRWKSREGTDLVNKMTAGRRETVWLNEKVGGQILERVLISYSPAQFAGVTWSVVARTPRGEITKLVKKSQMQSLVMAIFAVLVVLVGGVVLMRANRVRAVAEEKARHSAVLADKNEELERLSKMKDEFVSIVSHDLRSPIGVIQGFAKVMLPDAEQSNKNVKPIKAIIRSADRLLELINDILDLARVEAGEMELAYSDVDLEGLIKESFKAAEFSAEQKRIQLVYKPGDAPATIRVDNNKIYQVLNNLIGNAIKFSPENGTVTVSGAAANGNLKISVEDGGPGLSEEEQETIFDRFKQGDRKLGGSGLGLAICKQLVELHNGSIWVESAHGEGASFHFSLPVKGGDGKSDN